MLGHHFCSPVKLARVILVGRVSIHPSIHPSIHLPVYIYIYTRIRVCMCVYIYICTYVYVYSCTLKGILPDSGLRAAGLQQRQHRLHCEALRQRAPPEEGGVGGAARGLYFLLGSSEEASSRVFGV